MDKDALLRYDELLGFPTSSYQYDIFDFVEHKQGNAVISAYAGCGKTSSLVTAMKLVPQKKKCVFVAFNNSIVDVLSEKISGYPNCKATTIHKLGLQICYDNLGNDIEIDEFKYRTYLKKNINDLSSIEDGTNLSKKDFSQYLDNITELIRFCQVNLAQSKKEITKIAEKYNIAPLFDEISVTKKCLDWGKTHTNVIDLTDMIWLPNELNMVNKKHKYDWIFGDEVQDYSIAYIELLNKCKKRGARTLYVGDKNQAINSFAGSSEEAFDKMLNAPNTTVFQLPVSYRCPVKVVELARKFVPDLQYADGAIDGTISELSHIGEMKDGDLVICRSRAPLFQLYYKLLKRHVHSHIEGSDAEAEKMINIVNSSSEEMLNQTLLGKGVFSDLYTKLFEIRDRVMSINGLDLEDATLSNSVIQMYDTINSLSVIAEGLTTKKQLIEQIEKIFSSGKKGVKLSTIHKAKGGEADNVYILCYSSMPSSLAKKPWEIQQEQNLIYVALTRAKKKLGFVSETEIKPYGVLLTKDIILSELATYENMVCAINGTQPKSDVEKPQMARFKLKGSTKIEKIELMSNSSTIGSKRKKKSLSDLLG